MATNINNFIDQYCSTGIKGKGQLFVDLGIKYNQHPYFILSVAFADTTCGRNLTTPFNIGNVGNTDSCPTCQNFASWDAGIEAVAQTLSNEYLIGGDRLCDFSGGGWTVCTDARDKMKSKLYASSQVNWGRNADWAFSWLLGENMKFDRATKLSAYYKM